MSDLDNIVTKELMREVEQLAKKGCVVAQLCHQAYHEWCAFPEDHALGDVFKDFLDEFRSHEHDPEDCYDEENMETLE